MDGAGVGEKSFPTAAARATFWLPAIGVTVLAMGLYWGIPSRVPGSIPGNPALSPILAATSPALQVAFAGDSLQLSWDHGISRRANHAVLWIKDGAETQRLDLDSRQLNEGSVAYRPKHREVEFRLEALSPGGNMTASVRAIGGPFQAAALPPTPATVAVESPTVSRTASKWLRRERTAPPVLKRNQPSRNPIGTASRQVFGTFALAREAHTPAPAAISLPDPPTVQLVVAPPSASGKQFISAMAPANRPNATTLSFRASAEPVPASRRNFPAILKRSPRSDYVPPVVLRDPGLLNPPHRSVALKVNIDVKVYVNASGKVDYSEVLSEVAESNRDLAALAVFSARRWEFVPARTKDGAVPGEVIIHYQFGPTARASGDLAER